MASLELEARLDNLLSTAHRETADINLFAPITEREECPICMIPLPFEENEILFKMCCGKTICHGCDCKQKMTDMKNKVPTHKRMCLLLSTRTKESSQSIEKTNKEEQS